MFFACEESFIHSKAIKPASFWFYNAFRACQKAQHTRDSNNIQGDFMLNFSSIFLIHICSPDRLKSRWLCNDMSTPISKSESSRTVRCVAQNGPIFSECWVLEVKLQNTWKMGFDVLPNAFTLSFEVTWAFQAWFEDVDALFLFEAIMTSISHQSQCREIGHISSKSKKCCSVSCWEYQTWF